MHVIHARNVNHALPMGVFWFNNCPDHVMERTSRGAATLELDAPMTTVYYQPMERVLFSRARDANPFFHLFEAMWILAGREDVAFLARFLPRIADYSDDGVRFHAAYGRRLGLNRDDKLNQIEGLARLLSKDPSSRRAVCSIWNAELDAEADTKDLPCNDLVAFLIRDGKLEMTVYNRSNDMVWGAYGANAVQFAFIQEALASLLKIPTGRYYQVSNSFHVYLNEQWTRIKELNLATIVDPYDSIYAEDAEVKHVQWMAMGDYGYLTQDLKAWFKAWDHDQRPHHKTYYSAWVEQVIKPAYEAHIAYKEAVAAREAGDSGKHNRFRTAAFMSADAMLASDWSIAIWNWLTRRLGGEEQC